MNKKIDEEIIDGTTKIFKVLGDATRFRILYLLSGKEWSVNAIAEALDMEQSAVSHQLKRLREAKLVKGRREGKSIYYSQDDNHVYEILDMAVKHARHTLADQG